MSGDQDMRLAEGFAPADYDAWRREVEKALKGADFEKALTTPTYDGFRLQPLYTAADAADGPVRPTTGRGARAGAWDVRQAVTGPTAADVRDQIAEELSEGASSILLRLDAALRMAAPATGNTDLIGVGGAALHSAEALAAALEGADLAKTPIALDAGAAGLGAAEALLAAAAPQGLADGSSLGLDPISAVATAGLDGAAFQDWAKAAAGFDAGPEATLFRASSAAFFDAGASEAQELGALLAVGVAYLRAFDVAGLAPDAGARRIGFVLALSQDQFMTIAKARAARSLWASALKHAGVANAPMRIDGVTAERMFARHDMHVNVLRATIAGFAGAVGGLDGLTVLPFDARLGGRDPLARRIARNLQIVLAEESNLGRVADPAGGAFFVERLTRQLAEAGWAEFQKIERDGGIVAALENGSLAGRIAETAAARGVNVAKRRDAVTGVSEFANLADPPPRRIDLGPACAAALADLKSGAPLLGSPLAGAGGALKPVSATAPYEALRDASDAYLARTGARPQVFLANIGRLAEFNTRATFAANAFAAGGVAVAGRSDVGYADADAAAAAFAESGAAVACICGTDAAYGSLGPAFAEALKRAGAKQVWLAGRPGGAEADLRAAGVDDFVFMGADIPAALTSVHRAIGV